jgi:hypothetical protein
MPTNFWLSTKERPISQFGGRRAKITSTQRILKSDFTIDNKTTLASRAFNLAPEGLYRRGIIPCYFVMLITPRYFERRLTNQ